MSSETKVEKIVELMRTDDSVDAPADSLKWARNLIRTQALEPKKTLLRKIVAILKIDILPQNAVFGERSASVSQTRQLFFQAGDNGIDLRISKDSKGLRIQGQIVGTGFEHSSVSLSRGNTSFATVAGDVADFQLRDLPSGSYLFRAEGTGSEIVIEQLEL